MSQSVLFQLVCLRFKITKLKLSYFYSLHRTFVFKVPSYLLTYKKFANSTLPIVLLEREDVQKKAEEISKLINPDGESSDEETEKNTPVKQSKPDSDAPKVPFWVSVTINYTICAIKQGSII